MHLDRRISTTKIGLCEEWVCGCVGMWRGEKGGGRGGRDGVSSKSVLSQTHIRKTWARLDTHKVHTQRIHTQSKSTQIT